MHFARGFYSIVVSGNVTCPSRTRRSYNPYRIAEGTIGTRSEIPLAQGDLSPIIDLKFARVHPLADATPHSVSFERGWPVSCTSPSNADGPYHAHVLTISMNH